MAISASAVSPDGTQLALVNGNRSGASDVESLQVITLATGADLTAPRPADLAQTTRLDIHDPHWSSATTVSASWQASADGRVDQGANSGEAQWRPARTPGGREAPPAPGPVASLFTTVLPSGKTLRLAWTAASEQDISPYPLVVGATRVGDALDNDRPPVTPRP